MAGFSLKDYLKKALEQEVVIQRQVTQDGVARTVPWRARDVGIIDLQIIPATQFERKQDARLRAFASFRLLLPVVNDNGETVDFEASPVPFRRLQICESAQNPGQFYIRYPRVGVIEGYRQDIGTKKVRKRVGDEFVEEIVTFPILRPIVTYQQGYSLTPSQERFILTAYRYLRDRNGWAKYDVEEVPAQA